MTITLAENWQFMFVFGMDTEFTRNECEGFARRRASRDLLRTSFAGFAEGIQSKNIPQQSHGKISHFIHDGSKSISADARWRFIHAGTHAGCDFADLTAENGLLFTGDTYYPAPIGCFARETDFDAYDAIDKTARVQLAPQVKLVLGAQQHSGG